MEVEVKKDKKYGKFDDYEIEDAVATLERAEQIKADSEKMKYVKECMENKMDASKKAYKSISDMREEYKNMSDDA